jgi:TolA-binding protein
MKRGMLAISLGILLVSGNGCTPLSELEDENQQLLSRIDTLEVLRESCDSRMAALSQRITTLEQERSILADANRQLSDRLASPATIPPVVVPPNAQPSAPALTAVPATGKAVRGGKKAGAKSVPPAVAAKTKSGKVQGTQPDTAPQIAEETTARETPPVPTPKVQVQQPPPSPERALRDPEPRVSQTQTVAPPQKQVAPLRENAHISRPQGAPNGPMAWPESTPVRPQGTPQQPRPAVESRPAIESHAAETRSDEAPVVEDARRDAPPLPPPSRESYLSKYQTALSDFNRRKYAQAIEQFQALLRLPERNEMTDNCAYWIGESRYALGEYPRAADAFGTVLSMGGSDKADAALIMRGQTYLHMGRKADAKNDFRRLLDAYPHSQYAKQARRLLKTAR